MNTMAAVVFAAEELDSAAVRPSPLTSVVFLFLLVAVVLLLLSLVRHLRRAQQNLGPARHVPPDAAGSANPGSRPSGPADSGPEEGGNR